MSIFGTRRNFFERINMAFAGLVFTRVAGHPGSAAARETPKDVVDYYEKLGGDQANQCRWNVHLSDRSGHATLGSRSRGRGSEASCISRRITEGCRRISCQTLALRSCAGLCGRVIFNYLGYGGLYDGGERPGYGRRHAHQHARPERTKSSFRKHIDTTTITPCVIAAFASSTSRP